MKKLIYFLPFLLFACSSEDLDDNIIIEPEIVEPIDPYENCKLEIANYSASMADPTTGLIEGDIIPDKQNKAAVKVGKLWPNNTVPYFLNDDLPQELQDQIRQRIENLESLTYLTFVEYSTTAELLSNHIGGIHFRSPLNPFAGNSSHVGMQGGMQDLTLWDGEEDYIVDHEILHSLGFEHEIKRADRDEHIIMLWDNVPPNEHMRRQFDIDETATLCGNFDPPSVMMYGSYTGGWWNAEETNRPVYTDLEGNIIEQPTELSVGDIEVLKKLYPKTK